MTSVKKSLTSGYCFKTEKSKKKKEKVFALKYLHMNIVEYVFQLKEGHHGNVKHKKQQQNKQHIMQNVNVMYSTEFCG